MPFLLGVYVILEFEVMLIDYWAVYKERFLVIVFQKILTRIMAPFTEASVYLTAFFLLSNSRWIFSRSDDN